jgi:single-stranded-DNA-specific exonuclease
MEPWVIGAADPVCAEALAERLDLSLPTALVMCARGIATAEAAERFLAPRLSALRSPAGMAGFARAIERLCAAVAAGEIIGVFGDYDVDGVTSAALLTSFLRACGATTSVAVAHRDAGYGFAAAPAAALLAQGARVIVTADCGTSDHETLASCRAQGVDVIVVDHHQVPEGESPAYALINPHRQDCQFGFKGLCSAGVAFYLAAALRSALRAAGHFARAGVAEPDPRGWLDLVALGTIADLAPLTEDNRILVAAGLRVLGERKRPGLAALCERAGIAGAPTATEVSFRLAPRLNAPGRLGDATPALDLLLADAASAALAADACDQANAKRQELQRAMLEEAIAICDSGAAGESALLVAREGWHPGVVGIVAAKLSERYGLPAAVLAGENGIYRGSVRSVPGLHATHALASARAHLVRYGGHEGAAGLTVRAEELAGLRAAWEMAAKAARAQAGEASAPTTLQIDAAVDLAQIDERVAAELSRLGPFGRGNPEPVLAAHAETVRTRVVGTDHLQIVLKAQSTQRDAIAFRLAGRDPGAGRPLRVAFVPEIDEWRGRRRLRLRVRDFADA